MMWFDQEEFKNEMFKSAQRPGAWLSSAEQLRDAAEALLEHELPKEIPYFKARDEAEQEALAEANSDGKDAGSAEIRAEPPNYPPAQLLYAYAIENVLKGLIIAKQPKFIDEQKLNRTVTSHDLIHLAAKAGFTIHVQEKPVLEALSKLLSWAGRYPVALDRDNHVRTPNAHQLLGYGALHPVNPARAGTSHGQFSAPCGSPFPYLISWPIT